jgi:hypothetical protein
MQARVDGAIGISKQHTCIALAVAHVSARFWPGCSHGFSTHERLSRAFAGNFHTVAVLFGCRITSTLPKEHRKVTNKRFGPRYS